MNRKQLQKLYDIEQDAVETKLIEKWTKDLVETVIGKAKTGVKLHVSRYWKGELTESKEAKLIANLRTYFLDDVGITTIDVPDKHEIMLVVDWA